MIRTDRLRGLIVERGYSQKDVAKMIGVTPKTFYQKMKIGVFDSKEMQVMIDKLAIDDPAVIFFARK